jgi:hypothetical protein
MAKIRPTDSNRNRSAQDSVFQLTRVLVVFICWITLLLKSNASLVLLHGSAEVHAGKLLFGDAVLSAFLGLVVVGSGHGFFHGASDDRCIQCWYDDVSYMPTCTRINKRNKMSSVSHTEENNRSNESCSEMLHGHP